jgi:hypothetical protein
VADTAKEIEKLVMGDIEPAESQPQQDQSEQPADEDDAPVCVVPADVLKKDEQINDKASQQSASPENLDDSGKCLLCYLMLCWPMSLNVFFYYSCM